MELRSGAVVGTAGLRRELRPAFEECATLLFRRWTALTLAIENQWGGRDSVGKADWLLHETIGWFYSKKEHYVDELEEELQDAMVNEFNTDAEDGSPHELAQHLIAAHQQIAAGNMDGLERLRASAAAAAAAASGSRRQVVDRDGTVVADGEGGDSSSSDSESGDDDAMEEDQSAAAATAAGAGRRRPAPVVDDDGFTTVQTGRRR